VTRRRGRRYKLLLDDLEEQISYWIALCGELALEEGMDLSLGSLENEKSE